MNRPFPLPNRRISGLGRIIGFGGLVLVVVWSLLALVAHAGIEAIVGWVAGMGEAEGPVGSIVGPLAGLAAALDGPLIAVVWFVGVVIVGVVTVLARKATTLAPR